MRYVAIDHETDFKGWRGAARSITLNNIAPDDVIWTVRTRAAELFESTPLPEIDPRDTFRVSSSFIELAQSAILHRSPERLALLYRLLWRLRKQPDLLEAATDVDVAAVNRLAKDVHRDEHKMHAFVRFREYGMGRDTRFVAWFEPSHYIVEKAAPFFERRFADIPWSILTPDLSAHWDGYKTVFSPGAIKSDVPSSDPLEATWRTYYASIFNPARLKVKAMRAEMPQKYWRNLPEASLIDSLVDSAAKRSQSMIESTPPLSRATVQRKEIAEVHSVANPSNPHDALSQLREEAAYCHACPLYKDATQTVFGEGAAHASVMFVGEQPGDKEDLAGNPFVGPAGQMLDRAMQAAGIERNKIYITNAVKHFKFVPRGKMRLHQKPTTPEIKACRPWYERELAAVKPALVVALGATAAQCVFGKITQIGKSRGRLIDLAEGTKALVTVHPSYLLRLPDQEAKEREYKNFVRDLRLASSYMHKAGRAA
ncbi:MAG: UdgX family uracil-DNA binding protein [Xanthobacteraceae bacterium]|nr:UdgX family uracil-DNA binding protein [Xanthobacteraceae bacterium]